MVFHGGPGSALFEGLEPSRASLWSSMLEGPSARAPHVAFWCKIVIRYHRESIYIYTYTYLCIHCGIAYNDGVVWETLDLSFPHILSRSSRLFHSHSFPRGLWPSLTNIYIYIHPPSFRTRSTKLIGVLLIGWLPSGDSPRPSKTYYFDYFGGPLGVPGPWRHA